MKKYIGIDIGGTQIKYGILDQQGQVEHAGEQPSHAQRGAPYLMESVVGLVTRLQGIYSVAGLGISTAGQVDSQQGVITHASSAIPDYSGFPVKAYLAQQTGLPTSVENDVNCAMLGEAWLGAARNKSNALMLTLGTGIGGAILIDGKLYTGTAFSAGEWGYMWVKGQPFQSVASTSALTRQVADYLQLPVDSVDGKRVFQLAEQQQKVRDFLDNYFDSLAQGIANLMMIFDPECVIIGGGIATRDAFLATLQPYLVNYLPSFLQPRSSVLVAELKNQAGFIGAVHALQQQMGEH